MCVICGCSNGAQATYTRLGQHTDSSEMSHHSHTHVLDDGTVMTHTHHNPVTHVYPEHHFHRQHPIDLAHQNEHTVPTAEVPHLKQQAYSHAKAHGTTVALEQNLLAKNDLIAAQNRSWLKERNITALNLVSSPGAGKTTLLVKTIEDLKVKLSIAVIEGDQETATDAERIATTGCSTIQVNTGTGCHLESSMVKRGLESLTPPKNSLLLIENVGNLVCPALFDLGERAKVVMLSVTEGEDKPIKYPHMFRASQVMVITKIDLLPHVHFDVERCIGYAHQINPGLKVFQVSAITGDGLASWYQWLMDQTIEIH